VHLFEDGDVIVRRGAREAAKAGQGRVYPVVTRGRQAARRASRLAGRWCGHPAPFGTKVLTLTLDTLFWVFVVHALPSA